MSYMEKMARILPYSEEYAGEHAHYERTMDAICSRKPERMKPNGMDMLRAKVLQLQAPALYNDALRALNELKAEIEEVNHV